MEASVKGLLVGGVAVGAKRLVERGVLGRDALEARLSPDALALVEGKIDPAAWYPVRAYTELLDLLWEEEGGRDPAWMRAKGRHFAEKLYDADRFQQLKYSDDHCREIAGPEDALRQAKLVASVAKAFWSFVEPRVELDPEHADTLRLVFEGAAAFPEANRFTAEGFMDEMCRRGRGPARTASERPCPDLVIFRLPLRLAT